MELKNNQTEFKNEISKREIEYLVHFTPTINLLSIFELQRLLSRALLEKNNIDDTLLDFIEFMDSIRYDDKNYINLSISSPNYFLLNRFIERSQGKPYMNWCVLKIHSKYIYQKDTKFSVTNAASSIAKNVYGISGEIETFRKLFDNGISSKIGALQRGNLKPKYPTDVQAEILVKNEIDLSDILHVCFKSQEELAMAKAALGDYDTSRFIVDSTIFTNLRV